jgi:cyclase
MLKTRVVGVVLVRDGIAVQSIGFRKYLPIGRPEIAIEYLDRWGIDEIVVLHMDATPKGESVAAEKVAAYASCCQVPLAVGGGIADIDAVKRVIHAGADKVVLNAAAVLRPKLIEDAARLFGDQCVVISIDARRRSDGGHDTFTHSATRPTGLSAVELAVKVTGHGAGEILVNSIDRDGSQQGYDLDLLRAAVQAVRVPVIACGGAGKPEHMRAAMETGVAAVAAANFFNYQEHSVILAKRALVRAGADVRLDSYATYEHHALRDDGRLAKQADAALDALRFRYVPEEVI